LSYDDPLDKDRLLFTQNNSPIRLRCPECVRNTKILRHCRIFKNLPSLWWHIKQDHGNISNLLFNTNDIIKVLNAISKAKEWGIIPEPTPIYVASTTTSSLMYRGRPPRKDVREKLEKIALILHTQSELFPHYRLRHIRAYIGHVLEHADERTIKNYLDCIVDASEKNKINGTVDVTQFCSEFESGV